MSAAAPLIVTGAGGVGKTTISAALGVAAARAGRTVLVVTVDPAMRLADALGIAGIRNEPSPVPEVPGLSAAMLDVAASWEATVLRHAEPQVADRLLVNPFFRAIADRFPAAQAYAAAEQMTTFVERGTWDLVVVDTPPSAGGLDFFGAPRRMRALVGGRVLRWLTGARLPARRTIYRFTARPVLRVADAVLGGPLLEEIADFLIDLRTLYDGLSSRARVIERLMTHATILVVTTADPTPMRESRRFFDELSSLAIVPHGVVFNRTLPATWSEATPGVDARGPDSVALRDNLARWAAEAVRMRDAREEFAAHHRTPVAVVPWFATTPTSLDALGEVVRSADGIDLERLVTE